jgi:hypothetical protein
MYPSGNSRIYGQRYYSSVRNSTVHPASTHYPSVNGVNRSANVNQGRNLQQTASVRSNQSQQLAKQASTTTHQARDGRNLRQTAGVHSNQNQQLGKNTGTATKQAGNGRDRQLTRQDSRHQQNRLDAQTSAKLRDYKGRKPGLAEARRFNHDGDRHHNGDHHDGHHHHHDRDWWHNHCASIIWADWGWWGWYDGWWYPAWGYDPYYSYYAYDDPIYCYDGLPPDQIITNVQSALQAQGYYRYAVDGVMGPLTRAAIANFQRDHGLARTSAIDQPTLLSLGFSA